MPLKVSTNQENVSSKQESGLRHQLSAGQMAMVAVGGSIGTGLLLGSAAAIQIAGPAVILSFALAAFICWTVTMAFGELSSVHPAAGSFRLGESALIGVYRIVQVMGMQTRQDLPLFNVITDVDQHLSDYTRENDADMIRLLLVNGKTTYCRGCKRKRPRMDLCESETRSLLRVLSDNNEVGREFWRGRRTCVRLSMTTAGRTR